MEQSLIGLSVFNGFSRPFSGHLKLVDFGTSKDLIDTALNGQEFVGTAEYMSPETVKSKKAGPATDLWSLGVVLFHMLYGYTPFIGASPYMTFLRIKRAMLRVPCGRDIDRDEFELLSMLLTVDANERFANCVDDGALLEGEAASTAADAEKPFLFTPTYPYDRIGYSKLRQLAYFRGDQDWQAAADSGGADSTADYLAAFRSLTGRSARRVPRLTELATRAVASACVRLADETCANGGVKPSSNWAQRFDLSRVPARQSIEVARILQRRQNLHIPAVYRLFKAPGVQGVISARCNRTSVHTREYIGYDHSAQGHWDSDFFFSILQDPLFGFQAGTQGIAAPNTESSWWNAEDAALKAVISSINKLRPRCVCHIRH